jgi:hypothetical protein
LDPVRAPGEPTLLWHAFPLGLLGADQGGADRTCRRSMQELIEWLPHMASLGADGLLLGPVFASLSHGYDTVSHRTIDNTWLTSAELDDITTQHGALTYIVTGDGGSIRVRINPTTQTVLFPTDEHRPEPVLGTATTHDTSVGIPPHGWAVHRNVS